MVQNKNSRMNEESNHGAGNQFGKPIHRFSVLPGKTLYCQSEIKPR
jgi:hypothetical protein